MSFSVSLHNIRTHQQIVEDAVNKLKKEGKLSLKNGSIGVNVNSLGSEEAIIEKIKDLAKKNGISFNYVCKYEFCDLYEMDQPTEYKFTLQDKPDFDFEPMFNID